MAHRERDLARVRTVFTTLGLVLLSGLACSSAPHSRFVIPPAPAQCAWEGIERVVAVGDLHGDLDACIAILQDAGLVDDREEPRWTGGRTHLVQIGDVMDRGDHAREIFILLSRLEREAAEAGGMVHFLPGNHEELNLARVSMDYEGYVTTAQFLDFLHGSDRAMYETRARQRMPENPRAYIERLMKDDIKAQADYYDGFRDAVGGWIIGHSVVIRINGVVFVHGGISMEDSRRSLESINAVYRREFILAARNMIPEDRLYLFQENSPLWNRDLGDNGSSITDADVKQILSNLDARALVVGHTPIENPNAQRFGGLVWVIDSGIGESYQGWFSFLEFSGTGELKFTVEKRHERKTRRAGFEPDPGLRHDPVVDGGLRLRRAPAPSHS
jgi:hypothetical protein